MLSSFYPLSSFRHPLLLHLPPLPSLHLHHRRKAMVKQHNRSISGLIRRWKGYEELNPHSNSSSPSSPLSNHMQISPSSNNPHSGAMAKRWKKKGGGGIKGAVPVIAVGSVGGQRRPYKEEDVILVERHILEHWVFQQLLLRRHGDNDDPFDRPASQKNNNIPCEEEEDDINDALYLSCDALLFDFLLWLVRNDDPSLRHLDLEDLVEFYAGDG